LYERVSRRGKLFYSCNRYPDCQFVVWDKPILEPCPKCGAGFITEKLTKRYGPVRRCPREGCDWVFQPELESGNVLVLPERREAASRRPARTGGRAGVPPPGKKMAASARAKPEAAEPGAAKAPAKRRAKAPARKPAAAKAATRTKTS
jgi:DNA topoisomerase-1